MKTNLLIFLILLFLSTMMGAAFSHNKGGVMDIQFNTKDMPEQGLRIILPTDSSFDTDLASSNLPNTSPDLLKPLSIFVQNTGSRSIVAYMLRWELTYSDGKTIHIDRDFSSPAFLMEEWGNNKLADHQGNNINPNSMKFFSLVPPEKTDQGTLGSYSGSSMKPSNPLQNADQKQVREKTIKSLTEELTHVTSITISIDGVFFDDGIFTGLDRTNFFAKFKARCDAKRDLYNEVLLKIQSKEPVNKVIEYVDALSRGQQTESKSTIPIASEYDFENLLDNNGLNSSTYPIVREYNDLKKIYAREFVRQSQRIGIQKAIETIQSRIAKPWAPLRKL